MRAHVGVLVATRRGLNLNEDDVVLEVHPLSPFLPRRSADEEHRQHMPLPTRIGMRLLFHGVDHGRLVNSRRTEQVRPSFSLSVSHEPTRPRLTARRPAGVQAVVDPRG